MPPVGQALLAVSLLHLTGIDRACDGMLVKALESAALLDCSTLSQQDASSAVTEASMSPEGILSICCPGKSTLAE